MTMNSINKNYMNNSNKMLDKELKRVLDNLKWCKETNEEKNDIKVPLFIMEDTISTLSSYLALKPIFLNK